MKFIYYNRAVLVRRCRAQLQLIGYCIAVRMYARLLGRTQPGSPEYYYLGCKACEAALAKRHLRLEMHGMVETKEH